MKADNSRAIAVATTFGRFEDKSLYRYHGIHALRFAIASNRPNEDAAVTMEWYSQRGDASENRIKDLKVGFGMRFRPTLFSSPSGC